VHATWTVNNKTDFSSLYLEKDLELSKLVLDRLSIIVDL
jgi:hypothetical protein